MGGALALALAKRKYRITAVVSRSKKSARKLAEQISGDVKTLSISQLNSLIASDIILITTPDTEIASTAEKLALTKNIGTWKPVILHSSGSLSSEILLPLKEMGCAAGSMHPLASISEPRAGTKRFKNAYFCVEGDRDAQRAAKQIVRDLQGRAFSLETKYKPLYHAAAVMTSGHTTALFSTAVDTLTKCGLSPEKAGAVLLPLLKGTIENLEKQTPAQALTGTFARVDTGAFERHVKLLAENTGEDVLEIYLLLGKVSLKLAEEQGADKERIKVLRQNINKKLTSRN
jgi:predicted short-subunit dehydrogenase-like oxidoreductase (DUF2520 family)